MKTNIKVSMLAICMLFSGLVFSSFTFAETESSFSMDVSETYSWNAAFGAVNYTVDLEHVTTGQNFQYETTGTSVSLGNLPSGIYTVVVKAEFVDGSSIIIIEDLIDG